jgi:hypothetical protein
VKPVYGHYVIKRRTPESGKLPDISEAGRKSRKDFPMLRISTAIALLMLMGIDGGSTAQAQNAFNQKASAFDQCMATCTKEGGQFCDKRCQRQRANSGSN